MRVDDPLTSRIVTIRNAAVVLDDGSDGPEGDPDDDSDSNDTPVEPPPASDLRIAKADYDVTAGNLVVYTLTFQLLDGSSLRAQAQLS